MMDRVYGAKENTNFYDHSPVPAEVMERSTVRIINQLDEVEKMVEVSVQRLSTITDRLLGQNAEKDISASPKLGSVPSGVVGEINSRVDNIERKMSYLGRILSRLESI